MSEAQSQPIFKIWCFILGLALLLTGLFYLIGGGKLISLGGSWYFLIAGLLTTVSAIFIFRKRPAVLSPIPFTSFMDEFNLILLFYGNHIIVNWLSTVMYFHFYIWIFLFHFFCDLVGRILVHFLAIVNT